MNELYLKKKKIIYLCGRFWTGNLYANLTTTLVQLVVHEITGKWMKAWGEKNENKKKLKEKKKTKCKIGREREEKTKEEKEIKKKVFITKIHILTSLTPALFPSK